MSTTSSAALRPRLRISIFCSLPEFARLSAIANRWAELPEQIKQTILGRAGVEASDKHRQPAATYCKFRGFWIVKSNADGDLLIRLAALWPELPGTVQTELVELASS